MPPVEDHVSRGFCAFAARTCQQEHPAGSVRVVNQRNQSKGLSSGKPSRGWQISRLFLSARIHVLHDLLVQLLVKNKPKIKLILK